MPTPSPARRFGALLLPPMLAAGLASPALADEPRAPRAPDGRAFDGAPPSAVTSPKPPPLHVEYAQYGVALTAEMNIDSGAACTSTEPCILGSGGGLAIRGGYRSPGPWYIGGAYEFVKMDSSNLYRLGIFQQLRAEMRYLPDIGYRASPYVSWGLGAVGYGNEWGLETGGGVLTVGAGVEVEASRLAVLGIGLSYRPVLLAGWTDTAGIQRDTALVQFFSLDLVLEARSELGRR